MPRLREKIVPPAPKHVFEDLTGVRSQKIHLLLTIIALVVVTFAMEFSIRVYNMEPTLRSSTALENLSTDEFGVVPSLDAISVVMKDTAYTDCGQGLMNFANGPKGISGYLPFNDPVALAGLRAHCSDLDVLYYEAFSFDAENGVINDLDGHGAEFPIPEFHAGFLSRNRPAAFPVVAPQTGARPAHLEHLFNAVEENPDFFPQLTAMNLSGVDGGICIDMSSYPEFSAQALATLFIALNTWLEPQGLKSCLIGNMDAKFWSNETLVDLVQHAVLLGFQKTDDPSVPVAAQGWFNIASATQLLIPKDKLSVALGSFSTQWKSGQRTADQIPYAEAMLRTGFFEGAINFSAAARNTNSRYLDENRRLVQTWILDAVSFYNQRISMQPGTQIAIWPLGYEDPAIWDLTDPTLSESEVKMALEAEIDLSDHVEIEGVGPFSTDIAHAKIGRRTVSGLEDNGIIGTQNYSEIPSPRRIELFGASDNLDISVAFNGLGNETQTQILLDLLARYNIKATFFLTSRDLLLSEALVEELIFAGHSIGTMTNARNSRTGLWEFTSTVRNNFAQQLLQDNFGYHALFVQNPSRYGQFPGDKAVLEQLQYLQSLGFLPIYSRFPAPYGLFDPTAFISQVRRAAFSTPTNVLSFDFSKRNDEMTNLLLPQILQRLSNDGFNFISLTDIARLTQAQILPPISEAPVLRDRIIYWSMAMTWFSIRNFIFLLALIVALRSPVFLCLAFLRREKHQYDKEFLPPVTIVVPAYNEARVIRKTLVSILDSDYPDLKIVAVDDGSTDGTAKIISEMMELDDRITLFRQPNIGKWAAEVEALNFVDTRIFIIVDADTLLQQDAITYLVQPFCDHTVGAVSGTVEIGNRDNFLTACQVIEYKISQSVMRRAYEVFSGILVVPGAIGAWRKDAVIASGLVSGDTITEDADLTVALQREGFKVMYAPLAKSYTEAPNSVKSFLQQRLRWSLGMLQVAWKHKGSIIEGRPVGFISIVDAVWYRIISSIVYPLVDIIVLASVITWGYSLATQGTVSIGSYSIGAVFLLMLFTLLDIVNLVAAFWFERKFEWKLIFLVPLLRFGYRQLLYISSMRSIIHAFSGKLCGWQKLKRTATANIIDTGG